MSPEAEQLSRLRNELVGLFYAICGDVRNASKGDRSNHLNSYAVVVQEALGEVDKHHQRYVTFCREQVAAAKKEPKESKK